MFDHELIEIYPFEDIPLNRDLCLMDEKWMHAYYENDLLSMLSGKEYEPAGYISYAAARTIHSESIELSWYPNITDRFHEMRVTLPRTQFITCTECRDYDEKPRIFVRGDWLTNLHLREHSVFALIDAIGVKAKLERGHITRSKLIKLRKALDDIAAHNPSVAVISFADSLLLKSNWTVGQWDAEVTYTYDPEKIIRLLPEIRDAYRNTIEMEIYAVIAQGINEYYDDKLLHISGNHVSLNSLGLPFAQIMAIDNAARKAIHDGLHEPSEIYMDQDFFYSLRFNYQFDKSRRPKHTYVSPMASGSNYYHYESVQTLLGNFKYPEPPL